MLEHHNWRMSDSKRLPITESCKLICAIQNYFFKEVYKNVCDKGENFNQISQNNLIFDD